MEIFKILEICYLNWVSIGLGNLLGIVKVLNVFCSLYKVYDYEEVLEELKLWFIDELFSKELLV